MKHIKTYESLIKNIYKKGDVVLLKSPIPSEFLTPYAKIIRRDAGKAKDRFIDRYYVEILDPNTKHWAYFEIEDIHTSFIEDYSILKKVTPKEYKEYLIKKDSEKYNL